MLSAIFERFVQQSPVSVMIRGLMEHIFSNKQIDLIFEKNAKNQYTRELMFSSVVDLMSLVVCGIYPSINATYKAKAKELQVSRTAVYDKINRIEPGVSAALLRSTASEMVKSIEMMGGFQEELLPGYRIRILDGNCLAATDHRIEVLRHIGAKPLPGKSLVVLDPQLLLAIDIFPCEDGHAQERSLFDQVIERIQAQEVWIADRNMCTNKFLFGIVKKGSDFIIREHKKLPQEAITELQAVGEVKTGRLFEQIVRLSYESETLLVRRVVLRLKKNTRNGENEIAILSSLASDVAGTAQVAELYRGRWSIEGLFQTVTQNFNSEIQTLGYPKAALFSFCLAMVAYNILAVVRAALGKVHGTGKIAAGISDFYLVNEIQGTYRGMMIAIEPAHWKVFASIDRFELADMLLDLASRVRLIDFLKQPRAPKKKKVPPVYDPRHPHVSTARLLEMASRSP